MFPTRGPFHRSYSCFGTIGHSRINKSVSHQRRLNDRRRQSIAHLIRLRRDGGAEIMITTVAVDRPNLYHESFAQLLVTRRYLAHSFQSGGYVDEVSAKKLYLKPLNRKKQPTGTIKPSAATQRLNRFADIDVSNGYETSCKPTVRLRRLLVVRRIFATPRCGLLRRLLGAGVRLEYRTAGPAELRRILPQAADDPVRVGNLRSTQPKHIRRAGHLLFRRAAIFLCPCEARRCHDTDRHDEAQHHRLQSAMRSHAGSFRMQKRPARRVSTAACFANYNE
jgi:hypothetical protein